MKIMCLHYAVHSVGSSGKSDDDDVMSGSSYVSENTSDPTRVAPWCQCTPDEAQSVCLQRSLQ